MGDDIKLWEVYDGYNIGYKNGKYYVDNNGELVELGGGSFQEAANIASILGIQPTEPLGGGGGFTEKSDWERQTGHLKENRAYSKAIRQQRRLQRKNKFNLNNIMGKFPIFRNGGIVRFKPGGTTHRFKTGYDIDTGISYPRELIISANKQDTAYVQSNGLVGVNHPLTDEEARNLGINPQNIHQSRAAFDAMNYLWNLADLRSRDKKRKSLRSLGALLPSFSTPSVMRKQ